MSFSALATEHPGFADFWSAYQAEHERVRAAVMEAALRDPVLGAVVAATPRDVADARQIESRARLKRALETGDWAPYIESLEVQATTYARRRVPLSAWMAIARAVERAVQPALARDHAADVQRLVHAIDAMRAFVDAGISIIADRYMAVREDDRFERLVEAVKEYAIFMLDSEGRVATWNAGARALKGWTTEEIVGRPFATFYPPEERDTKPARVLAKARHEGRYTDEGWRVRKDGTRFWANVVVTAIRDGRGEIVGYAKVTRDLTDRKVAEEELRASEQSLATTLHSIGDGVIATDRRGRVTRMNPVAERLTGWSAAEAHGRPFSEVFRIVSEVTGAPAQNPIERVLREGVVVGLANHTSLISRDGTVRPVADSAAPIRDGKGALQGVVLVFRDQTPEREAARALRKAHEELEQRVLERTAALRRSEEQLRQSQKMEAIGRLAGGIAHDFNNLLSVILSYGELIGGELPPDNPLQNELLEIRKAGQRAADLTRQLLAFSRRQVLEARVVDLNQIVAGMDKLVQRLIGEDIEVRTVGARDLAAVKVDPGQIEQCLMNLVVNARDAMPDGGKLTIETANVELDPSYVSEHAGMAPGSHVMIAVTDTGCGMDKETLSRVFEPFFTTKEAGKGTGLGLSTVFGIVKQSGGHIWVYSEIGKGTTFKLYFPRAEALERRTSGFTPQVRPRGTETILLVEDEDQVRALASAVLSRQGYKIHAAENGSAALALLETLQGDVDLLLTDVVMPKMSGRELAEKIAPARPKMKVLFMSGYTDDTVVHHGVLDSGFAFLQKPITPDTLARKVREVLDTRT